LFGLTGFLGAKVINTANRHKVSGHQPIRQVLRRRIAALLAVLLSFSLTVNPVLAQTAGPWGSDIDIDPPVIDHEALESGIPGQDQEFKALVIDDQGLKHVWLFHRDRSGAQYASVPMQRVDETSEFVVTIDTALGQNRIEYYIEAVDTGGNRVLKGFPFFPLVRQLSPLAGEPAAPVTEAKNDNKLLYVILGVAAVGVGLALLSGGDDGGNGDGGDGPETPEPGTVPLTIVVQPPSTP